MNDLLYGISLIVLIVLNITLVALRRYDLRKARRADENLKREESVEELGNIINETKWSKDVMDKLDKIADNQNVLSEALLTVLRRDLMEIIKQIVSINRQRNTKSSKWYNVEKRIAEYDILEVDLNSTYTAYKNLGGNCYIDKRYADCIGIIELTRRSADKEDE